MGPILYRKTMRCQWIDILGASIASLGLSHAIAKGIISGLIRKDGVFKVTSKGKVVQKNHPFEWIQPIQEEVFLLVALLVCSIAMLVTRGFNNMDAQIWVALLSLQSLPYLSTLACQLICLIENKKDV